MGTPRPWQRLGSLHTGSGRRGCLAFRACQRVRSGVGAPRAGREGESAPDLGSSPFRPLLSLVRTGRCPVPTARPPQLCSPGAREGCWGNKREPETRGDRDAETQRQIQRGKVQSKASIEAHCELNQPWALWEPQNNGKLESLPSGISGPACPVHTLP